MLYVAQLLVRHLEDDVKLKIQRRAQRHGHSMEEEVREILRNAVKEEGGGQEGLGSRLAARFAGLGLMEDIPELRGQEARSAGLEGSLRKVTRRRPLVSLSRLRFR